MCPALHTVAPPRSAACSVAFGQTCARRSRASSTARRSASSRSGSAMPGQLWLTPYEGVSSRVQREHPTRLVPGHWGDLMPGIEVNREVSADLKKKMLIPISLMVIASLAVSCGGDDHKETTSAT